MRKIIRSQVYQLVLDKAIFLILIGWAILDGYGIYEIMYDVSMSHEPTSGGMIFGEWCGTSSPCVMLIAALIMTKDHFDKTLNYEILSGHSRGQVFMGRFLTALIISEVCVLCSIWTFPLIYTAFNGWGYNLTVGGALLKTLLIMLYEFRICAEMALFTMIFRRKGIVFFMVPAVMIIPDFFISEFVYISWNNKTVKEYMDWLSVFTNYLDSAVCDFEKITIKEETTKIYLNALPEHWGIVLFCTLGLGLIMLAIGYVKFAEKDME